MHRTFAAAALAIALSACGYQQETFAQDYATSSCLLLEQCEVLETYAGFESVESCTTAQKSRVDPEAGRCPDYDKKVGVECVDAINATSCAQFLEGYWPKSCSNVCPDGSAGAPAASDETGGTSDDTGR